MTRYQITYTDGTAIIVRAESVAAIITAADATSALYRYAAVTDLATGETTTITEGVLA